MFTLNRWKAVLVKSRMTGIKNCDVEDNVGNNYEVKSWNNFHSTLFHFHLVLLTILFGGGAGSERLKQW